MYRLLVMIAFLALPLAMPANGAAHQQEAVDLSPPDLFSPEWRLIDSREAGDPMGATAQFGGPNGARVDLSWILLPSGHEHDEEVLELLASLFDSYQDLYTDPERTRLIDSAERPAPPDRCATIDRFDGFELHYEFFRAGATLCVVESTEFAIVAYVAGEFNGLDGYRASDAVVDIVLDRISQDVDFNDLAA